MILTTTCNRCKHELMTRTRATDRVELARTRGEYLDLTCKECNTSDRYHVNRFSARPGRLALFLAFAIFIIGTPLTLLFIWRPLWSLTMSHYAFLALAGLLLVPVTVYSIIQKNERTKGSSFNRYKLKQPGQG